jgi:hypothetical protein
LILIPPKRMVAFFVSPFGGHHPFGIEGVLDPGRSVQGIRSLIIRIDERAGAPFGRTRNASRIARKHANSRRLIDGL